MISAWKRAGITQALQSTELLANQPRKSEPTTLAPAAEPASAAMPACFANPAADSTKEELLQQIFALQQAYMELKNSKSDVFAEVFATQEAAVIGRLKHTQEQIEKLGKTRVSVKPSPFGDVTSAEFKAAIVAKHAKQKKLAAQAVVKSAKAEWEKPVIDKLNEVDYIDDTSEATVIKLRDILKDLGLSQSGKRKALIQRLAIYYEIQLESSDAAGVEAAAAVVEDEQEMVEVGENQEDDGGEAEPGRSPEDEVEVLDPELAQAEEEFSAMCEVNIGAIEALLTSRSDQMKNHWDQQLIAAKVAFLEWQREQDSDSKN